LTEKTGTIFPALTSNFVNGIWSDQVTITKSESDVKITANSGGKTGQSNLFNVNSGSLTSFSISEISTQAAGEPFPLTITALDGFSNVVKTFSGTVDIAELTGTIDPVRSENFAEGRWTGNVTISQVFNDNQITVTRTGGIQSGQSNLFNVISSDVDYFLISTIPSQVLAGQPFALTITAKDKDNNTVDSFDGTATLSDLSNTITPKTTTNFVGGVWTGNITLTKSWESNVITVTSSGEVGNSNPFNVVHNELHHFTIAPVFSPQVAGTPFTITITAKDEFENTVKTYVDRAVLTDVTTTITPGLTTNFTEGVWIGAVSITKSQNDVQITATDKGKLGISNSFNIISGAMEYFTIADISTQATGEPFQLSVTARDIYGNVANTFQGTVDITDLTTTISPDKSDNFISGKWTGNATISSVINENKVSVQETGGIKFGESNIFPVISSDVDHFTISTIPSPQIAGAPFQITITAEDANNNVATAFSGTASLSDLTATLTPATTTVFTDGVWTGFVKITKAREVNKITVNALGKAGVSNEFTITHGDIDHFLVEQIASPQTAGIPFMVTVTAEDSMDNRVYGFEQTAQISDNTNTIVPTATSNFTDGQWSSLVTITASQTDIFITFDYLGKTGVSNKFFVKPNEVGYIKVTDAAGGKGLEVGERTVTLDEKFRLYASGYDVYDNYVRDVEADWSVLGTLDPPMPLTGESTVFDPQTPGTSGQIVADSLSLKADTTGTISVGAISFVKIFTLPGGSGVELADTVLTADDDLTLYCAGFDAGANYIGDVVVKWQSTGSLLPAVNDSSAWIRFEPTLAPASGNISVIHPVAAGDQTGTISVVPGNPVSEILLTADPPILPSDGTSLSSIRSDVIYDGDGNPVARNTLFSVTADIGDITSQDVSAEYPGIQVAANDSGKIAFVYQAPDAGGIAHINVSSPGGSSTGFVNLVISSLNIVSINSPEFGVSRGQQNVPVSMTVKNLGTSTVRNLDAGLTFTGAPPVVDRNDEFSVQRTDSFNDIPGGVTRVLTFNVDVSAVARLDTVTIDGYLSGDISGVNVGIDSAQTQDQWLVQSPAAIEIRRITSSVDTVSQGQENVIVSMFVKNTGEANAEILQDTLVFRTFPQNQNISSELITIPFNNNPNLIQGGGSEQFNFYVNLLPQTTLGNIVIDGRVNGQDENSKIITADTSADDSTHRWYVREAPLVRIKSLRPSTPQGTVSQNQSAPWYITAEVKNDGGTAVKLDSIRASFLSGGNDITAEYQSGLVYDTAFMARGNDRLLAYSEDSLRITMNVTGPTLGPVTIPVSIYLTDISTGKPIVDETNTGITVVEPGQLTITKIITSVDSVTRNQGQDWNVKVVLENRGGSEIVIKRDRQNSYIQFSTGSDFTIIQPTELANGGLILSPDAVDTLIFVIDGTGWDTGVSTINAFVKGTETTTGEDVEISLSGGASVLIEEPANIRILTVQVSETPNGTTVNTDQQFKLDVVLENNGMDHLRQAILRLQSDGSTLDSAIVVPFNKLIPGGGGRATKSFILNASAQEEIAERFFVSIDSAVAKNTPEPAAVIISQSVDASETMTIQRPGNLKIVEIITPDTPIRAGQVGSWDIKVVVVDSGGADIDLDLFASQGVYVEKGGIRQTDYSIPSSDTLQSGGTRLYSNVPDTLVYRVFATGNSSGQVQIVADLLGIDVNNQQQISATLSKSITIQTSAAVRLAALEAVCFNCNPLDVTGYVNKGQSFQIKAVVENSGRASIDSVLVRLTSNGGSRIDDEYLYIGGIEYEERDSLLFEVNASQQMSMERFSARIISAKERETGNPASIDESTLSIDMEIQEPAQLTVEAFTGTGDHIFTPEQEFVIKSSFVNLGGADVIGVGRLELIVPDHYSITSGSALLDAGVDEVVQWRILTPDTAAGPDTFRVVINNPLTDKNINQSANVFVDSDTLIIYTTTDDIIVNSGIIDVEPSAGVSILAPGQNYVFKSIIQYSPSYSNVVASIRLPENYILSAESDSSQSVQSLEPVLWSVITPDSSEDVVKTVYIDIMADSELVYTDMLNIRTIEVGFITSTIRILSPPGARDGILSTGQLLEVEAEVSSNGVENDIWSKLILPDDFSLVLPEIDSQLVSSGQGVKAQWRIRCGSKVASNISIMTVASGVDMSGNEVMSDTAEVIIFQIIKRSSLRLRASIISPEQAVDGIVTSGQQFTVEAYLENEAESAGTYGNYTLEISLPDGYSVGSTTKSAASNTSISWNITAPDVAASKNTIEIRVPDGFEPRDENSDTTAFFASGARFAFVDITTTEKSVNVYRLPANTANTVAKGENSVEMLNLVLINSEDDPQSNEEVVVKGITVNISDRNGQALDDPSTAISEIAVVNHGQRDQVYGALTQFVAGATLPIVFDQEVTITSGTPDTMSIVVDVAQNANVKDFMIEIVSDTSIYIEEALTGQRPAVRLGAGLSFPLSSDFVTLMANNLQDAFGNYPNPFGSSERQATTITYFLEQDANVDIKIYTLLGELVWSVSWKSSDPRGRAGSHDGDVVWDGRNDNGDTVLNGVYVAYISTSIGESATTKIAVLK
jgi:hypothetical protein